MYALVKRVLDILLAGSVLFVLSPALLVIMLILRFSGEGEVFYKQQRVGLGNKPFGVWKFVTMRKDSAMTGTITAKGDKRILPIGRFLRAAKINELPQLWNIICGEMSIVGPRPLTQEAFELYPEQFKPLVYQSTPGLTGIGSLVFRDEERILAESSKDHKTCYREDIMPIKGALEGWYLQNKSTMVDLKIIVLTAVAIVFAGNQLHRKWFRGLPETTLAGGGATLAASR